LPRRKAESFFNAANRAAEVNAIAVERPSGRIFENLMGVVSASDSKDFSVAYGPEKNEDGAIEDEWKSTGDWRGADTCGCSYTPKDRRGDGVG
jgi:hypothetical protein